MEFQAFYAGQEFEAYRFLGAHAETAGGTVFRTFAPGAVRIAVIGDFNGWQELPMARIYDGNFWECRVETAKPGDRYKYRITGQDGKTVDHCDPCGFGSEKRPATASVVQVLDGYAFRDAAWTENRSAFLSRPVNIYELHAGSWRRKSDAPDDWYTYRELAELLPAYLQEHGYNFVEFLPLSEHPCDASWGYQNTGFFAPTSRYGTPDDLRYLVDCCHLAGIGVLLDFVPVHFAVDDYALWNYDGTALYEYPHVDVGRSEWGSCNFMHSRGEVRSFLNSAAYYWLKEFHFDGLRMDAVRNLLYWQGDESRGENRDGIRFLQTMNDGLHRRLPGSLLIAEDSSSRAGITEPVSRGGLGFDLKWDLGWMHDTLTFFQTPPEERPGKYHTLTFSMLYFYQEQYLLPLSHDEVVHGKATVLQKMAGNLEQKFPQARALYLYMYAHPGKKLNFMGSEFGQLREWDENREQDWCLLTYPSHDAFLHYMTDLNHLCLEQPALYAADYDPAGFQWLDCHQEERCLYVFARLGGGQRLVFLFNLSGQAQTYSLAGERTETLRVLLHTDWEEYGGTVRRNSMSPAAAPAGTGDEARTTGIRIPLPPFSGICLESSGKAVAEEDTAGRP